MNRTSLATALMAIMGSIIPHGHTFGGLPERPRHVPTIMRGTARSRRGSTQKYGMNVPGNLPWDGVPSRVNCRNMRRESARRRTR